ncbi:putative oligomerization/nucleic acid binding protein [Kribbella sp. VKM Ac-2571]|uniref:SHOCT domain-containing protein n=1 Tax=Kribbella sp. VKM Ac-2571 TaxID=2512222 RepID=UPI00105BF840|nr:SHOCT domain-containing protein [Kribbella sp. VKM Ac-2571]TDO49689.1 putative oligomerization/nucleic acid binding protein [Kribbella sp. VKM Ac-2571]
MGAQLGHKVSESKAEKWAKALSSCLLPGEEILALLKCNNLRPQTEAIAVTNFRLGGFASAGWSVEFPYSHAFTMEPDAKKETVLVTVASPDSLPQGSNTRRSDMLFKMVQREDHELLATTVSQAQAAFDPSLYQVADTRAAVVVSAAATRMDAAARGEWPAGTRLVGSTVSKKAALAIVRQCHAPEDAPWLILGAGTAGVLAAWQDRLAIIKTGAMTGLMAGSLGGERSATFHFVDITGIEYNSGLLNGVLEVLTPSYAGGRTKDFWGQGENDPWKQSNCLPLTKAEFNLVNSDINELRSRIAASKRPTVATQMPAPTSTPPVNGATAGGTASTVAASAGGIVAQLKELALLHEAGVLTDEEFTAAKHRIISEA